MAHYAFLDNDNIVTDVIVGRNEDEVVEGTSDWEAHYGEFRGQRCLRTSYNGNIRKNYAAIGYTYDESRDAFIAPQPFPSWILNESNCQWEPLTPYPDETDRWVWDEDTVSWVQIDQGE